MFNQCYIIGKLTEKPKVVNGKTKIKVSLPRAYKNSEGVYETDIISLILNETIGKRARECLKKGDMVGMKVNVESNKGRIVLVVEKMSMLSTETKSIY